MSKKQMKVLKVLHPSLTNLFSFYQSYNILSLQLRKFIESILCVIKFLDELYSLLHFFSFTFKVVFLMPKLLNDQWPNVQISIPKIPNKKQFTKNIEND